MTESTETQQPPQQESRLKKTLLNVRVNFAYYFIVLILSFFSRKVFLDGLGDSFVGLTGTVGGVLQFLSLAELGIGTAINFILYKPLFERNQAKINELVSVFGFLLSCVGTFILTAGILISFTFPWYFPESETGYPLLLTYCIFYAFIAGNMISYFLNYRGILLGADQKGYIVSIYTQGASVIKTLLQMASAYWMPLPYKLYVWVLIELAFGILGSIILNYKIDREYPWLKANVKVGRKALKNYPEIKKYVKQIFVHRITTFVQYESTNVLIYTFVSVTMVAYYYNYMVILDRMSSLVGNFLGSSTAGVGNLVAEGNKEKSMGVYWELFTFQQFMAATMSFMFFILVNPFITLWLGEKYILGPAVLTLIIIRFFMGQTRAATDQFISGYGMFYDVWAPVTEAVIFIVSAIIGGHYYGLTGVLFGGVFSMFAIIWFWKPTFLFWRGFKVSVFNYWAMLLRYYVLIGTAAASTLMITQFIPLNSAANSYFDWIITAIVNGVIFISILYTLFMAFTPGTKALTVRILRLLKIDERKLGITA